MVYLFLADGFEETEAIAPADVLRRAGVEVLTVSVGGSADRLVKGAHGITVKADIDLSKVNCSSADAVILPGGMPGTRNLDNSEGVKKAVSFCFENGGLVCAICAAPSVLGHMGLLAGRKATCYPGFENELDCLEYTGDAVTVDGNFITANGAGSALLFGEAIAAKFVGQDAARKITDSMQCRFL